MIRTIHSQESYLRAPMLLKKISKLTTVGFFLVLGACGKISSSESVSDLVLANPLTDNTEAIITNVTSSNANGSYKAGSVINVDVTFSKIVTVVGSPRITLAMSPSDVVVNYFVGSGTTTLTFQYTVQAGDTSADLDYISTTFLDLNGGEIKDVSDRSASLSHVVPGVPFSLGANKNIVIDTTAPAAPSALARQTPATTPNNVATPIIRISGVDVGDTVKLFTDVACSTQVGSATVASGSTVDVTSSTLTDATYGFYANSTDAAGNISACSSATVAYVLDTTPPSAPSAITMQTPSSTTGTSATPILRVSGVVSGDSITLYSNSSCTTAVSSATAASGTTVDVTSSSLSSYATYRYYARSVDPVGNASACSSVYVDYTYQSTPGVSFSAFTQIFSEITGVSGYWGSGLSAWTKRVKLTINNSTIAESLTDFPALVVLNSSRVTYADFKAGGDDIRFTDSSGTNLSYEIEKWDTSGTSSIWVKIPSISASSSTGYIYMYYKNPAASAGANATGTWNSAYKGVFHLNSSLADSVAGNTGANNGTSYTASGNVAGGITTAPSNYVSIPTSGNYHNANFTIETSVYVTSYGTTGNYRTIVFKGASPRAFGMWLTGGTNSKVHYSFTSSGYKSFDSSSQLSLNTWNHLAYVYDGSTAKLYINGALDSSNATSGTPDTTSSAVCVGGDCDGAGLDSLTGSIDELSISSAVRTAGWIAASYKARNDTYLSYGTPESSTAGQITITVNSSSTYGSDITVPYTVSGTASNPSDHNLSSGNITITAGQTSGSITFTFLRDQNRSTDKTVIVTMGTPTNATATSPSVQTITLSAFTNNAPTAVADAITVRENSSSNSISVLGNDSDADGDSFTISAVGSAAHGTLVNNSTSISYTPEIEYVGTDTFTYTIADSYGATSTATVTVTINNTVNFTWTGAAGNNAWGTAGNWSGNSVPGSNDVAHFGNSCSGSNCNVTFTSDPNIKGISTGASYTGTITQSSAMTIGSTGWIQRGGTFSGGSAAISMSTLFEVSGGTFTSTSGTFTISTSGTWTMSGTGVFNANSGTLTFNISSGAAMIVTPGTHTYNNVNFLGGDGYSSLGLSSGTMTVNGDMTLNIPLNSGTVEAYKGITINSNASTYANATIKVKGNASGQTLSAAIGAFPSLTIDAGAHTVTLSGVVNVANAYSYVSGTVVTTGSTLVLGDVGCCTSHTYTMGNIIYNNLTVVGGQGWALHSFGGSTVFVAGDLTLTGGRVTNVTFAVGGNVSTTSTNYWAGNGEIVKLVGNVSGQTLTTFAGTTLPHVIIDTGANSVSLASAVTLANSHNMTITTGSLDMASFALTIPSSLTLSGTTLTKSTGVLTVGGSVIGAGAYSSGTVAP